MGRAVTNPVSDGAYQVRLEIFEGPLDLLYHMVKEQEIDIWDIPIAQVTAEYLAYLETLKRFDIEPAAEFVVMAARLLHIKATMLLPPMPGDGDEEDDPLTGLVIDLYSYKLFKEAAEELHDMGVGRDALFPRPTDIKRPAGNIYPDPAGGATVAQLLAAFDRVLTRLERKPSVAVPRPRVSVAGKISALKRLLTTRRQVAFDSLIRREKSRPRIVATFLALLELMRQGVAIARQDHPDGVIIIQRRNPR